MLLRMVRGALLRQRGKKLMIVLTVALGATVATAMLGVMLDVGDKVNAELKTYGANIVVQPTGAAVLADLYQVEGEAANTRSALREDELGNLKTIFWAYNIVDFAPSVQTTALLDGTEATVVGTWFSNTLDLPTGETVQTGLKDLRSWWDVTGSWPADGDADGALVGEQLAARLGLDVGDAVTVDVDGRTADLVVRGVLAAGGDEDAQVVAPLAVVQQLTDRAGQVDEVEVSALTTPDNDLARQAARNPGSLSISEWETWYCTAYVSSIAYQIEEVMTDAVAKPVRQVAESEGTVLAKTQLLMLLVTGLSLVGAALGIANLVTAGVMERAPEIGLLKAVGATDRAVVGLVLTEVAVVGLVGAVLGFGLGTAFAQVIGLSVFGSAITVRLGVAPVVAVLVALVVLVGSLPSIRLLLRLRPADVLHGR
jgi:putative ABC transport system permease protein